MHAEHADGSMWRRRCRRSHYMHVVTRPDRLSGIMWQRTPQLLCNRSEANTTYGGGRELWACSAPGGFGLAVISLLAGFYAAYANAVVGGMDQAKTSTIASLERGIEIVEFYSDLDAPVFVHKSIEITLIEPRPGCYGPPFWGSRRQISLLPSRILGLRSPWSEAFLEYIAPELHERVNSNIIGDGVPKVSIRQIPDDLFSSGLKTWLAAGQVKQERPLLVLEHIKLALEGARCSQGLQPCEKCKNGQQQSESRYRPMGGVIVPERLSIANDQPRYWPVVFFLVIPLTWLVGIGLIRTAHDGATNWLIISRAMSSIFFITLAVGCMVLPFILELQ
jgi:hypothetical protein